MTFDSTTISMMARGIWETVYMTLVSSAIAYLIGIPLGIILVVTDKGGIRPMPVFQKILGLFINLLRSIPFIILLIMVIPITEVIAGTLIGSKAIIPPLVFAAAPYIARMVESSFKEVDAGVIEAAKSMGATTGQIVWKVLLPEARPSLLVGAAISVTTILGYSAMAGFVGGGGLGAIAINYGYYRYEIDTMAVTVALLVIVVQIIQETFMKASRISDKRVR
ncbi:MAG: methionine ABC transporter permease [Lachnoclostridium edouardi]|uniref:methionine ABC transporter permease n=1 Tax=Lachnoclostridium edouardi TaxID=1926283 RepID=UPI0026DB31C9|nr:methionine ABC transporter permease [Lachnoclostridium edouardi]MDO4278848.1 methionine ABC transporter permease [Lachnoclostridium edouardi]